MPSITWYTVARTRCIAAVKVPGAPPSALYVYREIVEATYSYWLLLVTQRVSCVRRKTSHPVATVVTIPTT